jgi:hypothetical protein
MFAASLVLALGLAACGNKEAHPHVADNEGFYVDAGKITYQVQLSRELNQYNIEDMEYLKGLPPGTAAPRPDEEWFGVFLGAWNQTHTPALTAGNFDLVDTQGNRYNALPLDPNVNPYAWTPMLLKPGGRVPVPDSVAYFGPTQGSLLLFKINVTAYSNRPLILEIRGPAGQVLATVSIDL